MRMFFEFIMSPYILILIAILITVGYCFGFKMSFVNIREIMRCHFSIMGKGAIHYIFFNGVPLLLAIALVRLKVINSDILENINIVLSILITMLFTVLSLLDGRKKKGGIYDEVLYETFSSTIFQIFQIEMTMMISFGYLFLDSECSAIIKKLVSFVLYYGIFSVILSFFIIVKRLTRLFEAS